VLVRRTSCLRKNLKVRWVVPAALLLLTAGSAACGTLPAEWPGLDRDLTKAVDGYLAAFLVEPVQGGQVYCASETLEVEQVGNAVKAWVWVLCEEFFPDRGILQVGAGFSGPLMVYLFSNEQDSLPGVSKPTYMATGFAQPRDGSLMAEDIERIFPAAAIERMCLADLSCTNSRVARLEAIVEGQVQEEFNLPVATSSFSS